jgi:hypothetical protein
MRSAAVFSTNLRIPGSRPFGRAGTLRRRDAEPRRRSVRARAASHGKSLRGIRSNHAHRLVAPRIRPARKTTVLGFAAMVLH